MSLHPSQPQQPGLVIGGQRAEVRVWHVQLIASHEGHGLLSAPLSLYSTFCHWQWTDCRADSLFVYFCSGIRLAKLQSASFSPLEAGIQTKPLLVHPITWTRYLFFWAVIGHFAVPAIHHSWSINLSPCHPTIHLHWWWQQRDSIKLFPTAGWLDETLLPTDDELLSCHPPFSSPALLLCLQGVDGEPFEWQPGPWSSLVESSPRSYYCWSSQFCATVGCRYGRRPPSRSYFLYAIAARLPEV